LLYKQNSVVSLLFFIFVVLEFHKKLNDFDEEVKQVDEQGHGVGWHVFVALFSLLNDHLGVEDYVHAGNQEAAHHVDHSSVVVVAEHPAHGTVPEHAAGQGGDDATDEKETSSLAKESHGTETSEHADGASDGLNENRWMDFGDMVNGWSNQVSHEKAESPEVSNSSLFSIISAMNLVHHIGHANHTSEGPQEP
jgi:hypothetical protein